MPNSNRTSKLRNVAGFFPIQTNYLNSEWSYAQYRLPTPPAHIATSLSEQNRLGTSHPDAADEEKWTVGWIALPPDSTPLSTPVKETSPLPGSRHRGKGRATDLPSSPLRRSADRQAAQSKDPSGKASPAPEYQLIALTFTGNWYRLSLPTNEPASRPGTPDPYQGSTRASGRFGENERAGSPQFGSRRSGDQKRTSPRRNSDSQGGSSQCQLEEFRRFGSWDGWG